MSGMFALIWANRNQDMVNMRLMAQTQPPFQFSGSQLGAHCILQCGTRHGRHLYPCLGAALE